MWTVYAIKDHFKMVTKPMVDHVILERRGFIRNLYLLFECYLGCCRCQGSGARSFSDVREMRFASNVTNVPECVARKGLGGV